MVNQIQTIQERLGLLGGTLHHVKMHGALYNLSAVNDETAQVIINSMKKVAPNTILYVPNNSILEQIAIQNKLKTKREAFADRHYNNDLTLVSRSQQNAVITDKNEVINHLTQMIFHQQVKTISNILVPIQPETYCVHGDNKEAIALVKHIHQSLSDKGVKIA